MTVEEKAGQLNQLFAADTLTGPGRVVDERRRAHPATARWAPFFNVVKASENNAYQRMAVNGSRLHIPLLFGQDVIHGFRTLFPIPLGLSASWDPALIQDTAHFAGQEAAAQGVRWTFSPMVDIARDPRWGRIAEGAGEDPYLGSAFARAYVRGYQGESLDDPTSILACAKRPCVGYGALRRGRPRIQNLGNLRAHASRRLPSAVPRGGGHAGVGTIMSAFASLDGVPASANAFTLTQVLRDEWKFQGFVDSDWTAVREVILHGIALDEPTAARKSFLAGVDMDMESNVYLPHLPVLVRSGAGADGPPGRGGHAGSSGSSSRWGFSRGPTSRDPAGMGPSRREARSKGCSRAGRRRSPSSSSRTGSPVPSRLLLPSGPSPGWESRAHRAARGQRAGHDGFLDRGASDARDAVTLKTSLSERGAVRDGNHSFTFSGGTDTAPPGARGVGLCGGYLESARGSPMSSWPRSSARADRALGGGPRRGRAGPARQPGEAPRGRRRDRQARRPGRL